MCFGFRSGACWGTMLYWKKICFPLSSTTCSQFGDVAAKPTQKYCGFWVGSSETQLPAGLWAALRLEVPCKAFFRPLKQPRCGLTAEKGMGSAERVIGMLLNLLPVKDPPLACSFPHRAFQSSLDHRSCLVFGSVETSHRASSRQRMTEASEDPISRCFSSVLPHSFAALHLPYLAPFPLAFPSPSSSLLPALVSGAYFSLSLFCTTSS